MTEENKNEEIVEQQSQETELSSEFAEPVKEANNPEAEIIETVNEEQITEDFVASEVIDDNPDIGFEPVRAPEKLKETKKADYDMVSVSPVEFVSFEDENQHFSDDPKANLDIMQDIKMHITVELGRARSSVKKILDLSKGSIVELNKVAGEQVELYANGKFIAYGEVIVIEDKFGLRVTNVSHQNVHNLQ